MVQRKPKVKKKKVVTTKVIRPKGPSTAMKTKKGGVDHEHRWGLIVELGKSKAANILGISPNALNPTIKKYKDWNPELPFPAEPAQIVEEIPVSVQDAAKLEDQTQIERMTNEDYDERFYKHAIKINPKTKNHYFPSFSFLHSQGAPANSFLSDWYKDKAWYSEIIFRKRQESGSFIHNSIDAMIKHGSVITSQDIEMGIKHSLFEVKNALLGFMNWVDEFKPIIVASEHMVVSEELAMAGTLDLVARINKDDYKTVWAIDFKTSKSIFTEHRMQVEIYRRMQDVENCAILQLGNQTKKKFTFSEVSAKDRNELFSLWQCISATAYHHLLTENWIAPKEDPFPKEFKFIPYDPNTKP